MAAAPPADRAALRPLAWACAAFAGGVLLNCDRVPAWTAAAALLLIAWRLTTERSGARPRGGSDADEWLGLRPLRDGDSPRQVDWKAYAREAPLLVKEYRPAGSELHLFDFAQLTDPDTEARLSQLARWVLEAEAHGERYGVALPGVLLPPDRGPEHRHRCLAALAVFGTDDGARHGGGASG